MWDCPILGISALGVVNCRWGDAAFEGDGVGVECCLSSVHPAFPSLAGGVQTTQHRVQAFQRGLFGGQMTPGSGGSAHPGMQGLHRIGIWYVMRAPCPGQSLTCRFVAVGFGVLWRNS